MKKKLVFSLFGEYSITLNGRSAPLRNLKARALLAYLLIHAKQTHSRETLMTLLWPDSLRQSAQTSLRQTLRQIRLAIPDLPLLLAKRQTVQLNPDMAYELDVAQFEALIQAETVEELTKAITLYGGSFLHDLFVPDSNEFEGWVANRRALYLHQVLSGLDKVTAYHLTMDDYEAAVRFAQRQLEIDDLRETAVQQLMTALGKTGQRIEALAQYEQLSERLEIELGVEPSQETDALYQRIKRDELTPHQKPESNKESEGDSPSFQPPAPKEAPPNNLPNLKTPLVGRTSELTLLLNHFQNPEIRLITLLGPGGMGKTRLGLQATHEASQSVTLFPDGLFFVDLSAVETADHFVAQIATAMQLSFTGIAPPKAQLLEHIKKKDCLLFLDNFEQIVEIGADILEGWLDETKQIKFLITSRETLNLSEEWTVKITGLPFPKETAVPPQSSTAPTLHANRQLPAPDDFTSAYPAVSLFIERARQVNHKFRLDHSSNSMTAVIRICRLLEGMPLAIELAAPWVRMLSCDEIGHEIQKSLDFLASKQRDIDPRHRSMRAVFEHSWARLTAVEQTLLAQLSVFSGSFQRQAAMTVCNASLFDLVILVDKSLLQMDHNHTYRLHQLLRQFASEKLPPDKTEAVRHAHASYYADFLYEQRSELGGANQTATFDKIAVELENIKAAWVWQIEQSHLEEMRKSFYTIYSFHSVRNRFLEGKVLFETAVAHLSTLYKNQNVEDPTLISLLAEIYSKLGEFYYSLGQLTEAESLFQESIYYGQRSDVGNDLIFSYYMMGSIKRLQGYFAEAQDWLHLGLGKVDHENNKHQHAFTLMTLGAVEKELGNLSEAKKQLENSLALFKELNYQFGLAHAWRHLGTLAAQKDDLPLAQTYFEKSLRLCREIEDQSGIAMALNQLGRLRQKAGEYDLAYEMYQAGLELGTHSQEPIIQIRTMKSLGNLMNATGEYEQAHHLLRQALHKSAQAQAIPEALHVILEMAKGHLLQGQPEQALPLVQLALNHPASSGEIQEQASALQHQLPESKTVPMIEAPTTDVEKSLRLILEET